MARPLPLPLPLPLVLLLLAGRLQAACGSSQEFKGPGAPAPGPDPLARKDQMEASQKEGVALGVTGEFFRYKHIFHKQPTEEDRDQARDVGKKLRCEVCTAIVSSLVSKARSLGEDDLLDELEGHFDFVPTGDHVTDRMLSHKKGCNKHFKDELVAEGFVVRTCKDLYPERTDSEPCLYQGKEKPTDQSMNSYEIWKEILFNACEQSVSGNTDAIASYLAEELPGAVNRTQVARAACEKVAHCGGRPKAAKAGAGRRKASRGRRKAAGEL